MTRLLAFAIVVLSLATLPVRAADNLVERLATCQDSWADWKDNPAKMTAFRDVITASFTHSNQGAAWTAKTKSTILGLPVVEVYPQSIGMGVGFSATIGASFDATKAAVEKATGKSLKKCEASDGMTSCDLEIAPQRTLTLMTEDALKNKQALLGCYYFYEK